MTFPRCEGPISGIKRRHAFDVVAIGEPTARLADSGSAFIANNLVSTAAFVNRRLPHVETKQERMN